MNIIVGDLPDKAKILTLIMISIVLCLFLPFSAFAASADLENNTTGSNSENTNEVSQSNNIDVSVKNEAEVSNSTSFTLRTGNNKTNDNTTVEDISSGNINLAVRADNNVNETSANISLPSLQSVSASISNSFTGSNSENTNFVSGRNEINYSLKNESSVRTHVDINANTGGNDVSRNTTVGNVSSGNINVSVGINNQVNTQNPGGATNPPTSGGTTAPPSNPPSGPGITPSRVISLVPAVVRTAQQITESGKGGAFFPTGMNGLRSWTNLLLISALTLLWGYYRAKQKYLTQTM